MRAKPEEQVETRLDIASQGGGQEEGQAVKDKLVAHRVPPESCIPVTVALRGGLRAGAEGEETAGSGSGGCRSKQQEAEPAYCFIRPAPRTINKSPCEALGCLPVPPPDS